jgi:hypothetical protein
VLGGPARALDVRGEGRFGVVHPPESTGQFVLLDRQSDRTVPLGGPGWEFASGSDDPSILLATAPTDEAARTHPVFLPGLEEAWLEGRFATQKGWRSDDAVGC